MKKAPIFPLKRPGEPIEKALSRNFVLYFWLAIGAVALFYIATYFWGVEQPEHFLEKNQDYETTMLVNLFESKDRAKNYRLPAQIWRLTQEYYDETVRESVLLYVFFPNGGAITFENGDCALEVGKLISCSDDSGNSWYIELTNQKP